MTIAVLGREKVTRLCAGPKQRYSLAMKFTGTQISSEISYRVEIQPELLGVAG